MLAKITSKNRIALPPVRISRAGAVREKFAALGISEADVRAAVKWARS